MTEAVHQRQLKAGFEATMTREGLVLFRFTGTPLDAGPIDPSNADYTQDARLVQLIHARAEVLTFHAACLAMARGEATNSYGHSAANITPAVMIHFDEGLTNPASMDRGLMASLHARSQGHFPNHLAAGLQRNETIEWIEPSIVARSFELFDEFYRADQERLTRAVNMLVNASEHLNRNEYAQAFVLAWTEHCMSRRWDDVLSDRKSGQLAQAAELLIANEQQRQKRKPADFPIATRFAVMLLIEPTSAHYARAEALRKLRNDFVHDLGAISPSDSQRATEVGLAMLKAVYGMDLRLSAGFAYVF